METYYTIYKLTNKVNGKIYIGSHKTNDLNDGYMGSGKYLKYSQEKHGLENFEKEILFVFDNPEEMYAKEAELVTVSFIAEENTYNLKIGGFGGWDYVNSNLTDKQKKVRAVSGRKKTNDFLEEKYGKDWRKVVSHQGTTALRDKLKDDPDYLKSRQPVRKGNKNGMYGKTHSEASREKISAKSKGENNSNYGKRWIYSLDEKRSIKINKGEPIPDGWYEGRKLKF